MMSVRRSTCVLPLLNGQDVFLPGIDSEAERGYDKGEAYSTMSSALGVTPSLNASKIVAPRTGWLA